MARIGYNLSWDQDKGEIIDCVVCGSTIFSEGVFAPGIRVQKVSSTSSTVTNYECSTCGNITTRTETPLIEKKKVEEPELPTHTKPLLGLRKWIVQNDGTLCSTGVNQVWDTCAPMKATCVQDMINWVSFSGGVTEHEAPSKDCGCGLYAFYDLPTLQKEFSEDIVTVMGVASAWGKVIECENGMRAEYMQLEAFVLDRQTVRVLGAPVSVAPILRLLAKKHNVPLILPGEIGSFAGEKDLIKLQSQKKKQEVTSFTLPYPPPGATSYRVYLASSGQFAYTYGAKPDPPEDDTESVVAPSSYGKWKRIVDRIYRKGKGNQNG